MNQVVVAGGLAVAIQAVKLGTGHTRPPIAHH